MPTRNVLDDGRVWRPIEPRDRDWLVSQALPEESLTASLYRL
ncbi:hypothetical protein [Mycobacterium sp.]